jgi:hypothetical protein
MPGQLEDAGKTIAELQSLTTSDDFFKSLDPFRTEIVGRGFLGNGVARQAPKADQGRRGHEPRQRRRRCPVCKRIGGHAQ